MSEYLCYNGPIGNGDKHNHLKLKLGVSGAHDSHICGTHSLDKAKELGREIVKQGGVVVTGAAPGVPLWAAMGAKEEKGVVLGISPAVSEKEHVDVFRMPVDYTDFIVYTGFGFSGADLLFTRTCDAIFIGCGRVAAIHEFTVALQDGKPIGVLEGDWDTDETIKAILGKENPLAPNVYFDTDPKQLVSKVIRAVQSKKVAEFKLTK